MDASHLTAIISLLIPLSVVTERLVEIVKGFVPALGAKSADPARENWRRSAVQCLAVVCGIAVVRLARSAIPEGVFDAHTAWGTVALGLLASGGSGFWNSVLAYVAKAKESPPPG